MRKPVEELNAADLEKFPIWEFALDERDDDQDETWVQPSPDQAIPESASGLCVAAAIRLRCGLVYPAVLFGDASGRLVIDGAALLTTKGRVLFHRSDSPAQTRQNLRLLGLSKAEVFPLEYATRAPLSASGQVVMGVFAP